MNDDSALVEQLAEKVHAAWAAEKVRQGFADHMFIPVNPMAGLIGQHEDMHRLCAADGDVTGIKMRDGSVKPFTDGGTLCSIPKDKHHADMLPYADLAENIKEYDRATVRAVLDAIHQAGYLIVPNMTVPV